MTEPDRVTDLNLFALVRRLVADEGGQDLLEYALLTAAIGVAGVAVFPSIRTKMGNAFSGWGTNVYNLWIPLDPAP